MTLCPTLLFCGELNNDEESTTTSIQSDNKTIQLVLKTPRNFGYSAGDIIKHHIDISIPSGTELNTNNTPDTGSLLDWLDVIDLQVIKQSTSQHSIKIQYQVFKQVKETELLEIPMFQLSVTNDDEVDTITVPAWQFSYQSLIPSHISDSEIVAQQAQKPETLPTKPIIAQLFASLGAAILCLTYILWRRGNLQFWSRKTTAFQQALQTLKQLPQQTANLEQIEQAFRIVHSAFNQTAGQTLLEPQLDNFYENHPQFSGLRSGTVEFFKQSRQLFYESPPSDKQLTQDTKLLASLQDLCSQYDRLLRQR